MAAKPKAVAVALDENAPPYFDLVEAGRVIVRGSAPRNDTDRPGVGTVLRRGRPHEDSAVFDRQAVITFQEARERQRLRR